jgi:hypothetical protein
MNKDKRHRGEYGKKWNLGKPDGKPPQEVEKGEAPWKLNVGVERKSTADLESSIRAQARSSCLTESESHLERRRRENWKRDST